MKTLNLWLLEVLLFSSSLISAKEYHVSKNGNDTYVGSALKPFSTISHAAKAAFACDTITVHAGVYREWINPIRGGENDSKRIVYRAAKGEKVQLKGSEIITGWKKEKNGVWKVTIPNTFFGEYNAYKDSVSGDWFIGNGRIHHTGDVFLNGKSLFEKEKLEKVLNPIADKNTKDSIGSTYTWYCESDTQNTTIWANFHTFNPNKELIEISTRRTIFYPEKLGINYLTIQGFYFSQAATQWAAPTAEQIGMIATHWNKGWIIENNVISDSKCNGITLGKDRETGHNVWLADKSIDGSVHYIEVVFNTLRNGWNKENIGSHIVRNNTIFNCEQTGICGSMGAAFSIIENNHIFNIWTKRQFRGAEIAGIKFHGAIDTYIGKNRINNCGRGLWLDWMTQGTRISGNLFYNNSIEDIFLEVNHGPFIVDNNILLSQLAVRTQSEGGAYLHNLITGSFYMWPEPNRFTPYFQPHSTNITALSTIYSGDDRFYNNIFVGLGEKTDKKSKLKAGLEVYNNAKLPVWIDGNVYYNRAKPSTKDVHFANDSTFNPTIKLVEDRERVYMQFTMNDDFYHQNGKIVSTELLGKAKIPKAAFENPDGSSLKIDRDYSDNVRTAENNYAGPFVNLPKGKVSIKVW